MTKEMIIKAWKNEQYRHTLSANQQAELPANPAGLIELDDTFLVDVTGSEEAKTWSLACLTVALTAGLCVSALVGTCSPGGSLGCCDDKGIAPETKG